MAHLPSNQTNKIPLLQKAAFGSGHLVNNLLPGALGVFSFLTPIFGMVFGVWFLNEKIELNFFIGAVMVMLGIIIVSIRGWMDSAKSS